MLFYEDVSQFKGVVGQMFSASALIIIPSVFSDRRASALQALKVAICIHLMAIYFQVFVFFVTGRYVDYLEMIGLTSQVVFSKKGLDLGGILVPRFAGLYNEPGTYATLMAAMLAVCFSISRRISVVLVLGILSILATMSLGGMVIVLLLVLMIYVNYFGAGLKAAILSVLLAICCLPLLYFWVLENIRQRVTIAQGTTDIDIMLNWVLNFDLVTIFGNKMSVFPDFYSFGYLSVGVDFLLRNGVWGFLAILAYVASSGWLVMFSAGVVLLSKIKLTYPLLYVLLALIKVGATRSEKFSTRSANNVLEAFEFARRFGRSAS